jgi:hypothetical protein
MMLVALAVAAGLLALLFGRAPRTDRDWAPHLAVTPRVELAEGRFTVAPVTDWSYGADGPASQGYTAAAEAIAEVRNVWFVLEPHPGMEPMAHTLVLFEFPGDRLVGLTIEARREADEAYSAFRGAFNAFELAYIWSTARDLLARRAVMLDHDVLVYPLALDQAQKERFLTRLLTRTQELETRPRFYNTLVSNCTNELAKSALLDWSPAFILTGYSAQRLFELGLIPGEDFETARAAARMTDAVRGWRDLDAAEFDRALLAALRVRVPAGGGSPARAG